jgi:hypothetical protein
MVVHIVLTTCLRWISIYSEDRQYIFFSIRIIGGWVQLGPPGTSATDWSIVLAPGDYDDREFGGMKIGRGNRSTRIESCLALSTTNPTWPDHGSNPCRHGRKPATNSLSYGAALSVHRFIVNTGNCLLGFKHFRCLWMREMRNER